MKKLVAMFLIIAMMTTAISAFASEFGGLGDLFGALTQNDPNVGNLMNGLNGLLGGDPSSDKKTEEEESKIPSLIGPFSGKMVKVTVGKKTYTLHEDFKEAIDTYEAFFDSYIEFMAHADAPDFMQKYFEFMSQYTEYMEAMEKLDKLSEKEKDWTQDEAMYFNQVQLRISEKLYTFAGAVQ